MRSGSRARTLVALTVVMAGLAAGTLPGTSTHSVRADEVTASAGNLRNGWDENESTGTLTPATLTSGSFGELFDTPVIGQVYAQPLVIGASIIVATENDYVYSLDAATGAVNWQVSLGTPWSSAAENCTDLAPDVGVTSTPVYNPADGFVYLVSEVVPPGSSLANPAFYMNALNPATGAERSGWPVRIKGAPTNDPKDQFTPFTQVQRAGLLLTDGAVYAAFGSHCDFQPYKGYVVGVNTSTKAETMWTDEAGVTDTQAGIWQSGGGLMSDGNGEIIFASGNGISPPPGPGSTPPGQLAESVVRLAVQRGGSLLAKDFFSPRDAPQLDSMDGDLGSGGPVGLPFGTAALPHLLVEAGKFDGLFVLNRDHLGGREQGRGGSNAIVSRIPTGLRGEWGHPAAFADTPVLSPGNVGSSDDYVYYIGTGDALRYLKASLGGSAGVTPVLQEVAESNDVFGYTSGSPVVTSDGTAATSAVVWAVDSSGEDGATGMLQAFSAVPPGSCSAAAPCSMAPLWSFPISGAGKFTIPATSNGRVFIGTRGTATSAVSACGDVTIPANTYCGHVLGFGSPSQAPLGQPSPASVSFGAVAVGGTPGQQSVTITNTSAGQVTVESVTTASDGPSDPFDESGPYEINGTTSCSTSPSPSTCILQPGDTLTVPTVTFTPTGPGEYNGTLRFGLDPATFPNFPVVSVSLSGLATAPGFYASAGSINFGSVPVGTTVSRQITITNGDASAETLDAPPPGSPFTVAGLPSQSIPSGDSIPVTITYQPTATSGDNGTLSLTGNAADVSGPATVSLTGQGVADITPTLTGPSSLSFGSVPIGQQSERTITIANTGNLPAVIKTTTTLQVPFATPDHVSNDLPVSPGSQYVVHVPVLFTPTSPGTESTSYQVTWTDATGNHQFTVPVSGTGVKRQSGVAVPPPGGGWTFNGSASMKGRTLSLNSLQVGQAGSAVYENPLRSNGLEASFKAQIGGGSGADGLTFSVLDASKAGLTALGTVGSGLGYGGLPGVAVTLDTYKDGSSYPSANFVGIATSSDPKTGLLNFAATSNHVPALRHGTHTVTIGISSGTVTVAIDGKQVLSKRVAVPKLVLAAFTGATGGRTDRHLVKDVTIQADGNTLPPPGGGWSYNGSAGVFGSDTILTPAQEDQAGSVVYPSAVPAVGLHVAFNVKLSGGGGDGMTLALLNPSVTTEKTLGDDGLMLGVGTSSGLPGLAVELATASNLSGFPPNFAALTMHANHGALSGFQRRAYGIGWLPAGTHAVGVSVKKFPALGVVISVWLDGVLILQHREPYLTPTVRLAFTAGTSAQLTTTQVVRDIAISAVR